jgi:YVTN family beta-propeller protein
MPIIKNIFIIIAMVFVSYPALAEQEKESFIFIANEGSKSITMVNTVTKNSVSVKTSIMPHNVQATPNGKYILATGMPAIAEGHEHHQGMKGMNGKLLVIRTDDFESGVVNEVEIGAHPAHVITNYSGNLAFVTDSGSDQIVVVDIDSMEVKTHIATGKFPHGLRASADGKRMYVANLKGNSLSVIDPLNEKSLAEIEVGKTPIQVAVSVDGLFVYVSLAGENSVAVVDTNSLSLIKKIKVGHFPAQLFTDPKGRYIYAANQGIESQPDQTISIIDVKTNEVIKTLETGLMAHGIVTSDDGNYIYVTNMLEGNVSVISAENLEGLEKLQVGSKPNGITFVYKIN